MIGDGNALSYQRVFPRCDSVGNAMKAVQHANCHFGFRMDGRSLDVSCARPIEQIPPGDVVWLSPGEKHCHGVTATTAMTGYRHSGTARRQDRRVDGKGQRRTIPDLIKEV